VATLVLACIGATFVQCTSVLKRFGHVMLLVAVLAVSGGHWLALQTVAWSTMLAENLQSSSVSEAIQNTFDGNHPCSLCKQIAKGKQSEKKTEFPLQLNRLDFPPVPENFVLIAPSRFELLPVENFSAQTLAQRTPTPPPRTV
jgi:hypothetical protein